MVRESPRPVRLDTDSADFASRFKEFLAAKREVSADVERATRAIVDDVAARGDAALIEATKKFDRLELDAASLRITAEEIAAITAAPYFLRVFITPSVAVWADRTEMHRTIINALAWMALVLALLFAQMESFWTIFLFAVPFAIALSTSVPLTETIAVAGVRAHGLDYGRMRLWGSITFVVAGFAAGWPRFWSHD